jgi:hypothetical protein
MPYDAVQSCEVVPTFQMLLPSSKIVDDDDTRILLNQIYVATLKKKHFHSQVSSKMVFVILLCLQFLIRVKHNSRIV